MRCLKRRAQVKEETVDHCSASSAPPAFRTSIKPLDRESVLTAARRTGKVLIVQDEPPSGGYAPYVRCLLDELPAEALKAPPRIIAGADEFLPYYDERPFLPSLETVVAAAADLLE